MSGDDDRSAADSAAESAPLAQREEDGGTAAKPDEAAPVSARAEMSGTGEREQSAGEGTRGREEEPPPQGKEGGEAIKQSPPAARRRRAGGFGNHLRRIAEQRSSARPTEQRDPASTSSPAEAQDDGAKGATSSRKHTRSSARPDSTRHHFPIPPQGDAASEATEPQGDDPADQRSSGLPEEDRGVYTGDHPTFLWGKSDAGKSAFIAAFERACSLVHDSFTLSVRFAHTRQLFESIKAALGSNHIGVFATDERENEQQSGVHSNLHGFNLLDKETSRRLEVTFFDGPGGAMFEDTNGLIPEHFRAEREKLITEAKRAQTIIFCVGANHMDQEYFARRLPGQLAALSNEKQLIENCKRFIIVLTKSDILAAAAQIQLGALIDKTLDVSVFDGHQQLLPRAVADWIDPVETAKALLGSYPLQQIRAHLPQDSKIAVALCSAWGFTRDGFPLAGEDGSFQTSHLSIDYELGHTILSHWQPYGFIELIDFMLNDVTSGSVAYLSEEAIHESRFTSESVLLPGRDWDTSSDGTI